MHSIILLILITTISIYSVFTYFLVFGSHFSTDVLAQNTSSHDKSAAEKNQTTNESNNTNNALADAKIAADLAASQIAAVATIIAAALTGFLTIINQRKIASLDIQKIKENARTTYEFESRKRLYEQCEPILFQLVELSDYALYRITGLAGETREGRLTPNGGHLSDVNNNYFKATIYRLIAPMAAFRLLQSQLTLIDLSLDSRISIQYDIAKANYYILSADYDIAKCDPKLDYKPELYEERRQLRKVNPAVHTRQGIFFNILENLVSDLIIYDKRLKKDRVMRYGEFEDTYFHKETTAWKNKEELKTIVKCLLYFHPTTRPVLWRMLITQALLYDALKNIRENKDPPYIKSIEWMVPDEKKLFDWRQNPNEATDDEVLNQPFRAAKKYLQTHEKRLYDKLVDGI
jgi:hypothetical protein